MTSVNFNPGVVNGQQAFLAAGNVLNQTNERLSTALRINSGADDPSGLISSERLSAEIAALEAESRVMDRQQAVANVAEGALREVTSLTSEAQALAVANANTAGMSDAEREANQMQLDSIAQSIDRAVQTTSFNGERVFDGEQVLSVGGDALALPELSLSDIGQVEIDGTTFSLADAQTGGALAIDADRPGDTQAVFDAARTQITSLRGEIGAFQQNAINTQQAVVQEQTIQSSAARSIIRDADFAAEVSNRTRAGLLQQASIGSILEAGDSQRRAIEGLLG